MGLLNNFIEKIKNTITRSRTKKLGTGEQESYVDYSNYDGTNVNTGEILRIRRMEKLGKDETGRYLYRAYLENVRHEWDAEMMDSNAVPVCFSIDKRAEDILKENNPAEKQQFFKLLSQEKIFKNNNDYMNYIGAMDRQGNIEQNGERQFSGYMERNRKIKARSQTKKR